MNKTHSRSVNQTQQLATDLASKLKPGSVLALSGDLGSGKTTFIQGLAKGLGIDQNPTSPTYIIMRQYQTSKTPGNFYHLDLYRIHSAKDLKSLDLTELISENTHIIAIEWPEKINSLLPPNTVHINFKALPDHINHRLITINHHH